MHTVIIEKNDSQQRLDRFLKKYFKRAPLSTIQKIIRKKMIRVNGKESVFEKVVRNLGIEHIRTRPYSITRNYLLKYAGAKSIYNS